MKYSENGFTLVELSIVIVIIGLLVVGIMSGQSLLRSAEIRSIITDVEEIISVVNSYQLQYNDLPGDHNNAHAYFGNSCDGNQNNCNGDGDGFIEPDTMDNQDSEDLRAWQHLNLSGIMPGNFSGDGNFALGTNLLESKLKGAGYIIAYNNAGAIHGRQDNGIHFGAVRGNSALDNSALRVVDAVALDRKMDDGLAATGEVYAFEGADITGGAVGDCINTTPSPDAYNLGGIMKSCAMVFWLE